MLMMCTRYVDSLQHMGRRRSMAIKIKLAKVWRQQNFKLDLEKL